MARKSKAQKEQEKLEAAAIEAVMAEVKEESGAEEKMASVVKTLESNTKTEKAETMAYPINPVSNPGFDDGSTLRDGTDVTAIPTGNGTTVDASGTYTANIFDIQGTPPPVLSVTPFVDPANPTPAELATREAELQAFADDVAAFNAVVLEATQRSVALSDERALDPYERQHAI